MGRQLAALGSLLLMVTCVTRGAEPEKKPFAVEDLYRFDAPSAARLSPDNKKLAYARQWIDAATRRQRSSLWLVEGEAAKAGALEPDQPDARQPIFSPDGKWIVFLSTRPRPEGWKPTPPVPMQSDSAADIWLISVDGKKALPLAGPEKAYGRIFHDGFYGRMAFAPDGKRLVFVADEGKDPRTPEEIANDVQIVRDDQGEGYTGYGNAQIWIAHLDDEPGKFAASKIERLTDDDVWYGDPQWSPDGKTIAVHANKTADRESVRYSINKNYDIWAIDVATKKQTQLTSGPGPDVSPRFSPDGKKIACLSVPRKGTHMDAFAISIIALSPGGARIERVLASQPAPTVPLPESCWFDDTTLICRGNRGAHPAQLVVELVTKNEKEREDRGESLKIRAAAQQALTPAGNGILQERILAAMRVVSWENEGNKLEGVITIPPSSVAQAPYKLLLYPHGGPHGASTTGFNFTTQLFAAHGYLVFQPNFRGSTGYGQKFIDADRHDFGGGDMRDILTGIDALVKEKLVDPERQFVYGTSYGGFMTSWLVGHTNQFKAAVAQNAVTDLNAMWGLSDIQSWTEWEFGGKPWEVPAAMRERSPLTHAANVKTPTLILHARDDRRVPLPLGRMYYQALKSRGVPTQMVIYPDEGHGMRQPKHQEDVLRRVLAWFDKYGK
jgi:dipeptidyl aminopeptidase/acylaminoacyl peptidase